MARAMPVLLVGRSDARARRRLVAAPLALQCMMPLATLLFCTPVGGQVSLALHEPTEPGRLTLRGPTSLLVGELRLVATSGNATVHVVPFPLVSTDAPEVVIPSSSLQLLPAELNLTDGLPLAVRLSLASAPRAGTYRGRIQFIPEERPAGVIELEVVAIASASTIEVDPAPVEFHVAVGAGAATRGVTFLSAAGLTRFAFVARDLVHEEDPKLIIDRSDVKLLSEGGSLELPAGQARPFSIQIPSVAEPGVYSGEVDLVPQPGEPVRLAVRVVATETTTLTASENPLELVRSRSSLPGLLPQGWTQGWFGVYLEPPQGEPPVADHVSVRLRGEDGGFELGPSQIALASAADIDAESPCGAPASESGSPASGELCIPVRLALSEIPPDKYLGVVRVHFADRDDALVQTIDLRVRRGPHTALLLILVGLLLAPVTRYYQTTGSKQRRILARLDDIERWLAELPVANRNRVAVVVVDWMEVVRKLVYRKSIDQADERLTALMSRRDQLDRIFRLEDWIRTQPQDPRLDEATRELDKAVEAVRKEDDAGARQHIQNALAKIADAGRPAFDDVHAEAAFRAMSTGSAAPVVQLTADRNDVARLVHWVTRRFGVNSDRLIAESQGLVGVLVYVLLIVGLTIVGFSQLYVGNETFGSQPLLNYAGAFLWGFGSDLASKKLSDVGGMLPGS